MFGNVWEDQLLFKGRSLLFEGRSWRLQIEMLTIRKETHYHFDSYHHSINTSRQLECNFRDHTTQIQELGTINPSISFNHHPNTPTFLQPSHHLSHCQVIVILWSMFCSTHKLSIAHPHNLPHRPALIKPLRGLFQLWCDQLRKIYSATYGPTQGFLTNLTSKWLLAVLDSTQTL
jgi:hypothetical protein